MISLTIIITIFVCGFAFSTLAKEEERQSQTNGKLSKIIDGSLHKGGKASERDREVFDVIEKAGITINYLGSQNK